MSATQKSGLAANSKGHLCLHPDTDNAYSLLTRVNEGQACVIAKGVIPAAKRVSNITSKLRRFGFVSLDPLDSFFDELPEDELSPSQQFAHSQCRTFPSYLCPSFPRTSWPAFLGSISKPQATCVRIGHQQVGNIHHRRLVAHVSSCAVSRTENPPPQRTRHGRISD